MTWLRLELILTSGLVHLSLSEIIKLRLRKEPQGIYESLGIIGKMLFLGLDGSKWSGCLIRLFFVSISFLLKNS